MVVVENSDRGAFHQLQKVLPAVENGSDKVSVESKSVEVDRHNVEGSYQKGRICFCGLFWGAGFIFLSILFVCSTLFRVFE